MDTISLIVCVFCKFFFLTLGVKGQKKCINICVDKIGNKQNISKSWKKQKCSIHTYMVGQIV